MDNYIGVKLDGRYELTERIGAGGMADIYKAEDIAENKTVAVKILKNEFAGSGDFLRRFRNESKAIALLSHPNIVKIFDVGFAEKVQFIVMEYIDGITLTEYIEKQGVLKWREALDFTRQILKALQHAHDRGIVHRDIKSQNVMLLKDGTIKVMDFGIARFNREIDKTISEKAIGSVHYISPEQARGDVTDEKSDLYSVGIMLYEMLTGVKPFDGDDPLSIALMHTNKNPKRPAEINSSIPEGLEEITLRAMQKDPAKRYQTAGEMISDLREFEKNPSIVFEYKYFTPDGSTKHFDKVGKAVPNPAEKQYPVPATAKTQPPRRQPAVVVYDDDEEDDDYDEEIVERRSPLLPILFAVASVFVILTAWLIYMIFTKTIDPNVGVPGSGKEMKMPGLVNRDYEEVKNDPELSWLQLDPNDDYSSDYPKGTIMYQEVPEGRLIEASKVVKITVSKGANLIRVEKYNMWLGTDAINNLKDSFDPEARYDFSDTVPKDYVIRTDPPEGELLGKGDVITVYISRGQKIKEGFTKVPDLVTLSLTQAQINAKDYRITLKINDEFTDEANHGRVLRQSIDQNTEVEDWTEVEIWVGVGKRSASIKFTIPDAYKGDYTFRYYVDGVEDKGLEKTIDVGIVKDFTWEFDNNGTHLYTLKIKCEATGLEETCCTYEVDFTVNPPQKTEVLWNSGIFSNISGSGNVTTTAPPDTSSETEPTVPDYDYPW